MKTTLAIAVAVTVLAWPCTVAVATVLATLGGEAWQLDAWNQEPKRRIVAAFLDGWRAAAPWSLGAGVLAALDHVLLTRYRLTALLAGISLPFAGALLAMLLWPVPMDALPVLALTGLVLAVIARVLDLTGRLLR